MDAPNCITSLRSFIKSYLFPLFFVASCEDVMKMEPPVFNE